MLLPSDKNEQAEHTKTRRLKRDKMLQTQNERHELAEHASSDHPAAAVHRRVGKLACERERVCARARAIAALARRIAV